MASCKSNKPFYSSSNCVTIPTLSPKIILKFLQGSVPNFSVSFLLIQIVPMIFVPGQDLSDYLYLVIVSKSIKSIK